jgi:negative elongation factor A
LFLTENPCPQQGDIINIRLSEVVDTVPTHDGVYRPMIIETFYQMNYTTGQSRRIVKMRPSEPDAE